MALADDDGKIMNCKSLVSSCVSYYYYNSICLQSLKLSASLGFPGDRERRRATLPFLANTLTLSLVQLHLRRAINITVNFVVTCCEFSVFIFQNDFFLLYISIVLRK
jgi:hypothetical protein